MLIHGDLFTVLPTLAEASIDACVTDPPYGIGFMGKEWDTFAEAQVGKLRRRSEVPNVSDSQNPNRKGRKRRQYASPSSIEYDYTVNGLRGFQDWTTTWAREVHRVLKPGAYLLVCGAPRSYHRMACGLEDAGFVIRDKFSWLFGSGFPKNKNLGDGKGTALKPAHEPIALAWKPFTGSLTACHAQHGTAALNIDACRIETDEDLNGGAYTSGRAPRAMQPGGGARAAQPAGPFEQPVGRWPSNVLLDEAAAAQLDEQTGELTSGFMAAGTERDGIGYHGGLGNRVSHDTRGDTGGASRFYYVAKPSREERDYGCLDQATRSAGACTDRADGSAGLKSPRVGAGRTGGHKNFHPTVKPVELMRWLVRLVTPIGGTVLDPFTGSGTTGMACAYELRPFVGIEREAEYVQIAERRIAACVPLFGEATA